MTKPIECLDHFSCLLAFDGRPIFAVQKDVGGKRAGAKRWLSADRRQTRHELQSVNTRIMTVDILV